MTHSSPPVGRLAPSPTGALHVGHARSFLIAWWSLRSQSGRVLLRMDDLDHTRVKAGMLEHCLEDLEWLGLDWDGEPYLQSAQQARYQAAVEQLLLDEQAYACVCTRREIEQALSAPHASDSEAPYPGTCRGRYATPAAAEAESGRVAGIRLRVPTGEISWSDRLLGSQSTPVASQVGDFLMARRDQVFAYQLACAVDDAAQGITEVLRGDDLASSAPRQQLIQGLLGLETPAWCHVPLVIDAAGRRLAKRDGDLTLRSLREAGVDPRAVVQWVASTCGMPCEERSSAAELTASFRMEALPRQAVRFVPELLS